MRSRPQTEPLTVFTIGHSTRDLHDFIELLRSHGIKQLVDVRTIPRSRKNPQYNIDSLPVNLAAARIRYVHLPELGGLRRSRSDSPNTGWRNASFRGYADYMLQPEFTKDLDRLMEMAATRPTAIMCAEAVPWRCHRSLIADALLVRRAKVEHIIGGRSTSPHSLTSFARVRNKRITYPGTPQAKRRI